MSERTVYAIASGKGGVGKTTTAINLGAMLADRDHEVVIVDTDLGMANLADFLDFEIETPTLHEVLAGDADFEEAVDRAPGDIDVLPSATDIEAFAKSDPTNLQHVIADLREEYDYVLLDTGAGVSYDTLVPLALADAVLLVATPDVASVRDTAKTGELAERVESEVAGAVLTQRSSDILNADDVEETLGTDVLAVIPEDEAVPMGIDAGRPLAAFAPNAPAGQAYRDLAAVLTGDADPDPELDLDAGDDEQEPLERDGTADSAASDSADSTAPNDQSDENAFTGPELAENVRDAIGNNEGAEGLLGGELANAAEEIRKQANGDSSSDDGDASETRVDAADDREAEPGATDDREAEPGATDDREVDSDADQPTTERESTPVSGANEPRSVDDLINEHISDDRLGEDSSFGEDAADPLAGSSEESAGEDDSTDFLGDEGSDPRDGVGDEQFADERDPFADDGDESESERAVGDAGPTASDLEGDVGGTDDEVMDFDASEDESDGWTDEDEELADDESDDGPTDPDEDAFEDDEQATERDADEVGDEFPHDATRDDEDDDDGLIGRIGSIFK